LQCCGVLQCVAVCCSVLQCVAVIDPRAVACGTLLGHSNMLKHTATHCDTLQHTATHRNTLQHTAGLLRRSRTPHCNAVQCMSVYLRCPGPFLSFFRRWWKPNLITQAVACQLMMADLLLGKRVSNVCRLRVSFGQQVTTIKSP